MNLFRNILVPYNGQESGKKSFEMGLKLAKLRGSTLYILTCIIEKNTFGFFQTKADKRVYKKEKELIEKKFKQLKNKAKNEQVKLITKIKKGDLQSRCIVTYAKDNKIDLIVMSRTKLKTQAERIYYDSTVDAVSKTCKCSFLNLK